MSITSVTALLIVGTPVAADIPPPDLQSQQVEAQATSPGPAETPDVAPAGEALSEDNEIVVSGSSEAPPGDPLVQLNAQSFEVTQAVDGALVAPAARGYEDAVPKPVRFGLRNFFRNLKSPVIFLNYLLQLKPGKAVETLGRFVVNSTVGIGGLIDVAKDDPFNLPFRDNGFANTLGYYGVGPGPFFFLPLVGPTTLRDAIGGAVDGLVLPTAVGAPFNRLEYTIPTSAVRALDYRILYDGELQRQRATDDPYTASREYYLQRRKAEIDALHGRVPVDSGAFSIPAAETPAETSAPAPQPELQD